ncbi:MAG: acetylornithine deacetylase [Pseudomonadales bacterium]|jgi:acetylornithine deacetylase
MKLPNTLAMLRTLVGEPSTSSIDALRDQSNLPVINHLANWLEDLKFAVNVLPLPNKGGKANLIATLGSGEGGLVLSGHTDTVPCDEKHWDTDPYTLTEIDSVVHGLGSCDMKGFFPIALEAASVFHSKKLNKPLTILATSDEESSMAGARQLLRDGRPKADAAIIGEPTGLQPIIAHKGVLALSIVIEGSGGHASNPSLGCNALDAMHAVIADLLIYRQELASTYTNPTFEINIPTLNLGCLHAGDSPNRICETAELQIDVRLMPGMEVEELATTIQHRLVETIASYGTRLSITRINEVPAYQTSGDGALARTLASLSGRPPGTVAFGTEAPFLQSLGMETVVFGPGSINQAHQPNEYLDLNQLSPARETLEKVIQHYCT